MSIARSLGWCTVAILFMAGSRSAAVEGTRAPTGARARITVCLSDRVQLNEAMVDLARETVNRIFQRAGVEIAWIDQTTASAERRLCRLPEGANEVVVRIVRRSGISPPLGKGRAGGLALRLSPENGSGVVSVFYDCVQSSAAEIQMYRHGSRAMMRHLGQPAIEATVLGLLMAHEIGHVLLPAGHAPRGIMRATLGSSELKRASQGLMLFSDNESKALLARVAANTHQPRDSTEGLTAATSSIR